MESILAVLSDFRSRVIEVGTDRSREVTRCHVRIFRAIQAKDKEEATRLMEDHLREVRGILIQEQGRPCKTPERFLSKEERCTNLNRRLLMKIDVFTHVMPKRYKQALYRYADQFATEKAVQDKRPTLTDNDLRLRKMEGYPDLVQVLSTTMPPIEEIVGSEEAAELARMCNDEMAEMVAKNPGKYIAAIANLPLNNMDATLKEAERAITQLGFKGVQIYTRVNGKPISTDEMMPLYRMMCEHDLPIWIHPMRSSSQPDFSSETVSFNQLFSIFGWPYDTTAAMVRLVFAGVLEKFPTIKFITHHCGGMVPYFSDRLIVHYDNGLQRLGTDRFPGLTKHPVEYLRMFYADTALDGNSNYALECGLAFFGEDHVLFGTDMPYDVESGGVSIRETIKAIEGMRIPDSTKAKIYEGNARRLMHL